jgi:hypothetical protein
MQELLFARPSRHIDMTSIKLSAFRALQQALRQVVEQRRGVKRRWQRGVSTMLLPVEVRVGLVEPEVMASIQQVLARI